ncbi:MAG: biopolymer transporter ExbD [Phycisphaerae bacterium]|nr:biopolymer transporter ExbD [Phycisphaerae bacterium]
MTDDQFPKADDEVLREKKKRGKRPAEMEINMTPLIDVLFMLMLFFLLGTRFAASEGALASKMPQLGTGGPAPAQPPININIAESGGSPQVMVNSRPTEIKEVYRAMKDIRDASGGTAQASKVFIKPEKNVSWNYVLQVYNSVKRAGFEEVNWSGK